MKTEQTKMLSEAMSYHYRGLNVIPVNPGAKTSAINWSEYQNRQSTSSEIMAWFSKDYNIGLVNGRCGGQSSFVIIDIDKDIGIYSKLIEEFPLLAEGAIWQSGSGGIHIPLFVNEKTANKTWHTILGSVNIRASHCYTVAPPSIHQSGEVYKVIQDKDIIRFIALNPVMKWFNDFWIKDKDNVLYPAPELVHGRKANMIFEVFNQKDLWRTGIKGAKE